MTLYRSNNEDFQMFELSLLVTANANRRSDWLRQRAAELSEDHCCEAAVIGLEIFRVHKQSKHMWQLSDD